MRVARVEAAAVDSPYARSLSIIERRLPHVREDIDAELAKLVGVDGPPIPCPPRVSIIPGLGGGATVLKVRVRSTDLTKGRSGGLRVLLLRIEGDTWRPLLVYAKGDREDVSRDEVLRAISEK
jgi:hypothetical protein